MQYLEGRELTARLDAYKAVGARWVRFQLLWDVVERDGAGRTDWGRYDNLLGEMRARGLRPLPIIQTTPPWARAPGCGEVTCAPRDPRDYARFAGEAARRYAGTVAHWEIWNEPNSFHFWKPAPDPRAYAETLRLASRAIRAADPTAAVITGGLAPAGTERKPDGSYRWINPVDFLEALYAAGAGGTFDAIAAHPYTFPQVPGSHEGTTAWREVGHGARSLRSVMEAQGDGDKQIWATEFGAPTGPEGNRRAVSEDRQAETLRRGYEQWSRDAWAGPMIVWTYRDAKPETEEARFGLVRVDGTRKPAYEVFRRLSARRLVREARRHGV